MAEIMENTEIIENAADVAEDIVESSNGDIKEIVVKGTTLLVGVGIGLALSKLAKPVSNGIKNGIKKLTKKSDADDTDIIEVDGYVTIDDKKEDEEGKEN